MRNVIASVSLLVIICGCSERQPRLEPLARGLAEAWQPATRDLKLAIQAENNRERVTLHCVLQNISATPIEVNSSTLPWITPGFFSIDAVTASGRVVHRSAHVMQISSSTRQQVTIASGGSMNGILIYGSCQSAIFLGTKTYFCFGRTG
jgi:hypothetical protein